MLSRRIGRLATPRQAIWVGAVVVAALIGVAGGRYATSYVLPLMFAVAVIALTVAAPQLSLYVLLVAAPFSFRYILPNKTEAQVPSEPLVGALVGAYLLDRIVRRLRGARAEPFPFTWPLAAVAVSMFASAAQSPMLYVSAKASVRYVAYAWLAFPVYALLSKPKTLHSALRAFAGGGVVAALAMEFTLLHRIERLGHSSAFRGALFSDYVGYGSFLSVFILFLIAGVLFDPSAPNRVWRGLLLCVFGFGMLLCLSRGAWAALIAGVLFMLAVGRTMDARHRWVIIAVGGALVAVVALIPGAGAVAFARFASVFDPSFASNQSRLLRWGFALLMFAQHPVLGAGPGMFAQTYVNESFLGDTARFKMGAHSVYMQTLAETGIVGFVAMAWLAISFYMYGFRLLRARLEPRWRALVAGAMAIQSAFFAHFLVGSFLARDTFSIPFWGIFGLLPAIANTANFDARRRSDYVGISSSKRRNARRPSSAKP